MDGLASVDADPFQAPPAYDLATFTYEGFLEELLHRYRENTASSIELLTHVLPMRSSMRRRLCVSASHIDATCAKTPSRKARDEYRHDALQIDLTLLVC